MSHTVCPIRGYIPIRALACSDIRDFTCEMSHRLLHAFGQPYPPHQPIASLVSDRGHSVSDEGFSADQGHACGHGPKGSCLTDVDFTTYLPVSCVSLTPFTTFLYSIKQNHRYVLAPSVKGRHSFLSFIIYVATAYPIHSLIATSKIASSRSPTFVLDMKASAILLYVLAKAAAGAVVPRNAATTVTVTVPCQSGSPTVVPTQTWSTQSFAASSNPSSVANSGGNVTLGPVSNPSCDPSDLNNIVPKSNLSLFYGSNDTSTPDSNAQVSLQMKVPSVLLEEILSVRSVVCSDTGVVVTFDDLAGYEKSMSEWPASGDFVLFTNHLGNCDTEFERGLFLVDGLTFDETTLTVVATAEKSDFQSTAG